MMPSLAILGVMYGAGIYLPLYLMRGMYGPWSWMR